VWLRYSVSHKVTSYADGEGSSEDQCYGKNKGRKGEHHNQQLSDDDNSDFVESDVGDGGGSSSGGGTEDLDTGSNSDISSEREERSGKVKQRVCRAAAAAAVGAACTRKTASKQCGVSNSSRVFWTKEMVTICCILVYVN
jgi:hypothetical protein